MASDGCLQTRAGIMDLDAKRILSAFQRSIDILARLGQAFRYESLRSEELVLDGIRVRVATPAMLYRMKKDTVRPQDRLDAETLRREFELDDES